ncbi:hypothetical protein ACFP6B_04105 [Rothia nasimurium]|uniref:hypothetical protein n=1 Tax=Rothia nasimurium TaxID=85336 RepID=UPI00360DD19C
MATAAVPAYAASFTCPDLAPTFSRTLSGNTHQVTASYSFPDAGSYTQIVLVSNAELTEPTGIAGATLSADRKTLTIPAGSGPLEFSATALVPQDQTNDGGFTLRFTYTINNSQCGFSSTFAEWGTVGSN